jgi:hypothetical protein
MPLSSSFVYFLYLHNLQYHTHQSYSVVFKLEQKVHFVRPTVVRGHGYDEGYNKIMLHKTCHM